MNNKERREEPWKRGMKEMSNKEGKEELWKRWNKGTNRRRKGRIMEEREARDEK